MRRDQGPGSDGASGVSRRCCHAAAGVMMMRRERERERAREDTCTLSLSCPEHVRTGARGGRGHVTHFLRDHLYAAPLA